MVHDFFVALRFLTIFPFAEKKTLESEALARSTIFFPLVGLLIGAVSFALFILSKVIFPERFAVLILVAAPILLSGGLHVDGFSDFCDGFFGARQKVDILRIMRDSRIGAWAATGVTLLILAKFELLQVVANQPSFFLMAMSCSRWSQVALSFYLPYAGGEDGLGKGVAQKVSVRELLGSTLFLLPLFFWTKMPGVLVFIGLIIFLGLLGILFHRKIGGVTGDLLGAASELSEICVYLFATILSKTIIR